MSRLLEREWDLKWLRLLFRQFCQRKVLRFERKLIRRLVSDSSLPFDDRISTNQLIYDDSSPLTFPSLKSKSSFTRNLSKKVSSSIQNTLDSTSNFITTQNLCRFSNLPDSFFNILLHNDMLNSDHINVAHLLLKERLPNLGGLQER